MNNLIGQIEENYIFFSIGSSNYAFDAGYVVDIIQLVELEYPEAMPAYIVGLFEYNNQLIKIVDLRNILKLDFVEYGLNSKIIIVKTENETFGFVVDDVKEIKRVNAAHFNSTPFENGESSMKAIYTDKELTSVIINIESIKNKINSHSGDYKLEKSSAMFLPSDMTSKQILHRRKLHYARKMKEGSDLIIKSKDAYITFALNENICCTKILHISGFYKFSNVKLTKVPCTPEFVVGVASLKGRYITVIDLLKFTENKTTLIDNDANIIVIECEDYEIGIITPTIGEIIDFDESKLKFKQNNKTSCVSECVMDDKMYLFLDVKKLFSDEKFYIS